MCSSQWLRLVLLSMGLAALTEPLRAAELRTSIGDRPLVRQVSFEQEFITEALPVPQLAADPYCADRAGGCACGAGCGHAPGLAACGPTRYWGSIEYLLWWRQQQQIPPLVTTSPAGTAQAVAGQLNQATTTILLGDEQIGGDARPGVRIALGAWLDTCHCWGLGGSFFGLSQESVQFGASSDDFPILARPFFDVDLGQQSALLVAHPDTATGILQVASESEVWGADVLLRRRLCRGSSSSLYFLMGYQYGRIEEDLRMSSSSTVTEVGGTLPIGTTIDVTDFFETRNVFNGGSLGLVSRWQRDDCWRVEALAKVGLGNMSRRLLIDGRTETVVPGGGTTVDTSGLLAQSTNIGVHEDDQFAAVPELGLTLSAQINRCADLMVGYTLIYYGNVLQPGEQIDLNVDLTQPPGGSPQVSFQETDYWVQGIRIGLEGRY